MRSLSKTVKTANLPECFFRLFFWSHPIKYLRLGDQPVCRGFLKQNPESEGQVPNFDFQIFLKLLMLQNKLSYFALLGLLYRRQQPQHQQTTVGDLQRNQLPCWRYVLILSAGIWQYRKHLLEFIVRLRIRNRPRAQLESHDNIGIQFCRYLARQRQYIVYFVRNASRPFSSREALRG